MQYSLELAALLRRQLLENPVLLLLRQVFEDVGGIVGVELPDALGDGRRRHVLQDFLAELSRILCARQTCDRHGDKVSVTQVSSAVGVGAAHGFGHQVDGLVRVRRAQVEGLEHVQHLEQRHSARAGRRDRQDRESSEVTL